MLKAFASDPPQWTYFKLVDESGENFGFARMGRVALVAKESRGLLRWAWACRKLREGSACDFYRADLMVGPSKNEAYHLLYLSEIRDSLSSRHQKGYVANLWNPEHMDGESFDEGSRTLIFEAIGEGAHHVEEWFDGLAWWVV